MQVLLQGVQDAGNVIESGQLAFKVRTPGVVIDGCCDWPLELLHVWQMHNEQGCKCVKVLQSCNGTIHAMQRSDLYRMEWHASTRHHKRYRALTLSSALCSSLHEMVSMVNDLSS